MFHLDQLLLKYGEPSNVLLSYSWMGEAGILYLYILLFMPDEGILTIYSIESQRVENTNRSCPQGVGPSEIVLWSPTEDISLSDIYDPLKGFMSLEKATGMDIVSFFQTFSDPKGTTCIEIPVK
jgi:hypothetical protein